MLCASADKLPWLDGSIPVVTLRHVPHHLERPGLCLSEAWRVASRGLVIAEPIFDPSLPGQRLGQAADRLLKRLDRARGVFHAECLAPADLLELLGGSCGSSRVEALFPLEPWTADDMQDRLAAAQGALALAPEDADEWNRLIDSAHQGQVSKNGTIILSIQKTPFG